MKILQSRLFARSVRKFHRHEKKALDDEIRKIIGNPESGQGKRGELKGVFVHKFKIYTTLYLLSYKLNDPKTLELIMIGPHENFYRDLENYIRG
ncbi:MAG: type II toxin-antitoxin system RelE/ParE family toxin [Candidatus Sabulitectum sp.]|nr:type II toxin-antitoxin system RelE/ParE family toxin [Candidatus Sabulitectum sp.]